ncbi:MAG TPA: oligosaccharide flippase family protein [Anaerolineae bacterium]|nr:oligosaccharide flippase family protein [Anaerolineae bacterium]
MSKRQILINATMSVTQIVVISVVLFVLYKFLLNTIGVAQLGIWSLVLATTSVTQIANFGLSGSVVKFVAKYVARGEDENISGVVQTAALSVAAFGGCVLLIGYPIAKWVLGLVIENQHLPLALSVLPYAFLALWSMMITGIFQAGLDGYQRIDLRSLLLMGGAILHLLLCFVFAPIYGLIGVAYARVLVNVLILISSWLLLKRCLPVLPVFPYRWNKGLLREIIDYGINFQIISITAMLYDPVTKALLSKFGGLSMVGYYEMASRMVQQFRALIISANQVLVPAIADLHERNQKLIQGIYKASYRLIFYIVLPFLSIIIVLTPLISEIWIGHYESIFVFFAILLAVGWFLNILAGPAYFANLGTGDLRWNTVSHVTTAVLNGGLGLLFGIYYGGTGVVIAFVFSLVAGSLIIPISYHIKYKIPLRELFPRESIMVGLTSGTGILVTMLLYYQFRASWCIMAVASLVILTFSSIIFIPIWVHPMRKRLTGWINYELLNKR